MRVLKRPSFDPDLPTLEGYAALTDRLDLSQSCASAVYPKIVTHPGNNSEILEPAPFGSGELRVARIILIAERLTLAM